MVNPRLAILSTGLVTSVGLNAKASCAAIRCKISNPTETRFIDSAGEWIMAHKVPLEEPWSGRMKLAKMAALAIEDCLELVPRGDWAKIPLLVCVAERERPGRIHSLEEGLLAEIQTEIGIDFNPLSKVIPHGRVSFAIGLLQARDLIDSGSARSALIVGTDGLSGWATLSAYDRASRLLTPRNSNGFVPGEAAGAVFLGVPEQKPWLTLCGLGFSVENTNISVEAPLRGEGLATAIKQALAEASCDLHDLDFRITDLSGEQYYFKESALALSRILRVRKESFDIWHPAECIGEIGAASGFAAIAVAHAACVKDYAPGPGILLHAANDDGRRAAVVLRLQAN